MIRSYPRISAFLIGSVFAFVMLCGAEGSFYLLNQQNRLEERDSGSLFEPDALLGYKPRSQTQITSTSNRKRDGALVYDVVYSIDAFSRRKTPVKDSDRPSLGSILYFGCSFTFGEGVNDDETMPAYVSRLAPEYRPYNYGFRGYGPQQMFAKLQSAELAEEVDRSGHWIAVYTFIDAHVSRVIGSMRSLYYTAQHPYFTLDRDDHLMRNRSFASGRPALTRLYQLLSRSQTLKFFRSDWPRVKEGDLRLTARLISESRTLFHEQFNSDDFYVLIYPGSTIYGKRLIPYLKQANITYFDYSSLPFEKIPYDGHPTARTHQAVAERLTRDLNRFVANR